MRRRPERADDRGVAALPRLLRRHPLALLIALSSIVVTILYVLSEFLVLGLYERRFTSETELAALLATVFAAVQIIEAVLLLTLSRRLLERTGPLFRNLVFPLTSLATLVHLAFNPRLAAAILVQINNDAICNAVFLPVHTANYLAVPAAMQGRIRTLAEGICYPLGLALAGLMLMWMGASTGTAAVQFSAITLALALLLLGTAIGSLFLPALLDTGEVGVLPLARTGKKPLLLPAETADRVRTLLRAAEAEPSLMGIQLCRGLDLDRFTAELVDLAARADPEIRRELVALAHDAPWAWAGAFLWACAERGGGAALVALEGLLARQAEADPALLARLRQTGDAEVQAIAG